MQEEINMVVIGYLDEKTPQIGYIFEYVIWELFLPDIFQIRLN